MQSQEMSSTERLRWATQDILNHITPFDVRCLIHVLDVRERAGEFQCVFPMDDIEKASHYLGFFERPRYANLLIAAFFDKYGSSSKGEFFFRSVFKTQFNRGFSS